MCVFFFFLTFLTRIFAIRLIFIPCLSLSYQSFRYYLVKILFKSYHVPVKRGGRRIIQVRKHVVQVIGDGTQQLKHKNVTKYTSTAKAQEKTRNIKFSYVYADR